MRTSVIARCVVHIGLVAACGNPAATATKATANADDCFAQLDEPPAMSCGSRAPITAAVAARRRAAAECLADVNRAAKERARQAVLERERLTRVELPTITVGGRGVVTEQPYPSERLVTLRYLGERCGGDPELADLHDSFIARDATGQLVRVVMQAEVVREVGVRTCGCTGCGPDPGPPAYEAAVLPPGEQIARELTVTTPIQRLKTLAPPCP